MRMRSPRSWIPIGNSNRLGGGAERPRAKGPSMRFMRLGDAGAEIPAVTDGTTTWDLRPLTADIDGAFLATDGLARAESAAAGGALPELATEGLRVGPPIARPQAVICIGMNYAAHARESG